VPSYTAWWLRRHVVLGGRRPADLRAPDSDPLLAGLYDTADNAGSQHAGGHHGGADDAGGAVSVGGLGGASSAGDRGAPDGTPADAALARVLADPVVARALGVRRSLAELLAEPDGPDELLRRLADPARSVSRSQLRALWAALATTDGLTPDMVTPPDRVRAIRDAEVVVAADDDALILDAPDLWPLLADQPLVLAPYNLAARLADLLDLPLASEEIAGTLDAAGERQAVPGIIAAVLPDAPPHYHAHDKLTVDGIELPWRYRDGEIHAATPAGLASALAWQAGQWPLRHLLTALLTSPDTASHVLADADLDPLDHSNARTRLQRAIEAFEGEEGEITQTEIDAAIAKAGGL